ncbi:hypothetical protein GO013_15180 [Pseudodesulfovibrio sp. JC047]|uniref:hypothetical protein n=1 Tax=Pseudodesulfovibrio sp. JC047 TaxID=2683199 RepID=UPI0013D8BE8F|nr:hypothetical protein [Pseudodesulfovibrio sp. JC047]NDV20751.1 hypothetical protein [Pseudodesulfovibrio sp. JC047]
MSTKKKDARGEINGMSYGKIMTSLLIPKDARNNPKRVLSGIAFLAFVCFFLFAAFSRGCHRDAMEHQEKNVSHHTVIISTKSV